MYTTPSSPNLLSSQEISKAADYLASTRDKFLESVAGLSDEQWNFKPASDQWSIAENAEHVALIEERIHSIIQRMPEADLDEPGRPAAEIDEAIPIRIALRTERIQAPPFLLPTGRWQPAEAIERFRENRKMTLSILNEAPALRGRVIRHPISGPWDGYQWILAAGAHLARHTDQIREVKEHPAFPA